MSKKSKDTMRINSHVRALYSPEFSSMIITYFNLNLAFHFHKYLRKDNTGKSEYDTNSITASVTFEGAASLYLTIISILNGTNSGKEIKGMIPCNMANLIFEYKQEQENQMVAYLVVEKDKQVIPFKFASHTNQVKENGQITTETFQSGLCVFAKTLDGYLTGAAAIRHYDDIREYYQKIQEESPQGFYSAKNNNGYQRSSW